MSTQKQIDALAATRRALLQGLAEVEDDLAIAVFDAINPAPLNMTREQLFALATCGHPLKDLVVHPEIGCDDIYIAVNKHTGYTMGIYPDGTIHT